MFKFVRTIGFVAFTLSCAAGAAVAETRQPIEAREATVVTVNDSRVKVNSAATEIPRRHVSKRHWLAQKFTSGFNRMANAGLNMTEASLGMDDVITPSSKMDVTRP